MKFNLRKLRRKITLHSKLQHRLSRRSYLRGFLFRASRRKLLRRFSVEAPDCFDKGTIEFQPPDKDHGSRKWLPACPLHIGHSSRLSSHPPHAARFRMFGCSFRQNPHTMAKGASLQDHQCGRQEQHAASSFLLASDLATFA